MMREATVTVSRDLAERLLAGLRAAETPAGHLAQKVTHERLGYCGWRSESPRCTEHKRLVAEVESALETGTVEREPIGHAEFARFVQEAAEQRARAERAEAELAAVMRGEVGEGV